MTTLLLIIPNLGTGGAQNVFRDQFRFFSKHVKTIGCVFNWDGALQEDKELGFISLDVPAGASVISKASNFNKRIKRLKDIKATNQVTHSISHLEGADYVNILSRRHEKIFCWLHGTKRFDREIKGGLGLLRKKIMMPLLYRRSKMIAVSEGIRTEMIDGFGIHPDRIITIVNGFDLERIGRMKNEEPAYNFEQPTIVCHCRLAPQKNLAGLINVFAQLKGRAKLVLVGDGELRDQLVQLAESIGLVVYCAWRNDTLNSSQDLFFVGRQSNPYSILAQATVYAMTSAWEGFPLSLGEALACGVPSLATDCFTGPREIIAPGFNEAQPINRPHPTEFGVLMPFADSEEHVKMWADEINKLLSDPAQQKKYSEAGVRRISQLDHKEINKKWLELLDANE